MGKKYSEFTPEMVGDLSCFQVGCLPSHSDHICYRTEEEWEEGTSSYGYSLTGLWKFFYAKNFTQMLQGYEKPEFDCKNWDDIRVPAHIQMEGYDIPQYVNKQYPWEGREDLSPGELPTSFNPVAHYVKYVNLTDVSAGMHLVFEGVESGMALWVNGAFVGYHEDSFTRAEFDISPHIKVGENKIAVSVFKWTSGSWCEDQDFFRFSGIFRDVYLCRIPRVHLEDLHIVPTLSDDLTRGHLHVEGQMSGAGTLWIRVRDGEGQVGEGRMGFVDGESWSWNLDLVHPRLWSSEKPYLYQIAICVYQQSGEVTEYIQEAAGFRKFVLEDGIMKLNGERIVFYGVNRHEFSARKGRAISVREIEEDLIQMKRSNINAIRTSHYPNRSEFYRLCDRYGFYVIDEMNMETHGTWETPDGNQDRAIPKDDVRYEPLLLARGRAMYERDKNHPCILMWSLGNESYGGSVIARVGDYFRGVDIHRLVHYEGIRADRSYPDTSDMESQMYTPVWEIRQFLKDHRDKPFICCEYSHAMGNSCGAIHKYVELSEEEARYQGGFIWDYVDQAIYSRNRYGQEYLAYGGCFGEHPNDGSFSGNGIVDGDRRPTPKMQEVKKVYQPAGIRIRDGRAKVWNKHLFTDLGEYSCHIILDREGVRKGEWECKLELGPGERRELDLSDYIRDRRPGYEYCLGLELRLDEDTSWGQKGHVIAWGQEVLAPLPVAGTGQVSWAEESQEMTLIDSPAMIGVKGLHFEVLFSKMEGRLTAYRYGGKNLLSGRIGPNFWRAPIDNDKGCLLPAQLAQWKLASLYPHNVLYEVPPFIELPKVEKREDWVEIRFTYCLPTQPKSLLYVNYRVEKNGKVTVEELLPYVEGLPSMPEFGMILSMPADFNRIQWYGPGPEETYADRKEGGRMGIYEGSVAEQMASYLVPQETGMKTDVRWARVTDPLGRGLCFRMQEKGLPLMFSALPYSPNQLEEADKGYELPPVHHTYVRVAGNQMGVGGDNSWGARPHEEYMLKQEDARFCFSFQGVV